MHRDIKPENLLINPDHSVSARCRQNSNFVRRADGHNLLYTFLLFAIKILLAASKIMRFSHTILVHKITVSSWILDMMHTCIRSCCHGVPGNMTIITMRKGNENMHTLAAQALRFRICTYPQFQKQGGFDGLCCHAMVSCS